MRQAGPVLLAAVALAAAAVIGFQLFALAGRLDALDQRMAALDEVVASANEGLDRLDERLGSVDESLDDAGERVDGLEGQLDTVDERLDEVADDVRQASELFWPPGFPTSPPALEPVIGTLGEPFDVSVDPLIMPMTSGRYTVLSAKRLENDVEIRIRWEATVGPLSVSSFSWRGYDDTGTQYDGVGYTGDDPETAIPIEGTLAEGRQREGSVYLIGAAGAEHLWIELVDFFGGNALAEVQLW